MANLEHLFSDGDEQQGAVIIDLSQIALATVAVSYEPGTKFTVPMVRHLILSTIKHNALKFKSQGFETVIIAIDNAKFGYWRRQEQDYYKRNRAIAREAAEEKEQFDWEGYFNALGIVIQELKDNMPYTIVDVRHAEADDCIAVLSKFLSERGFKVRIISSDGDFTQLHKIPNVDQYSPVQKKFVKVKTGSPEEDCMVKIIKGDRKDCVASVKVRGDFWLTYNPETERTPQNMAPFIKSFVGKNDDEVYELLLEEVTKRCSSKKDGLEKAHHLLSLQGVVLYDEDGVLYDAYTDKDTVIKQIATKQFDRFIWNRVLIDFDYIRQDIRDAIIEAYTTYTPAPRGKIYSYFVKSGLSKLIKDINNF